MVYEKGVKNVPKLRSLLVQRLGFRLWKDQSPEIGKKQIKKISKNFKSEDEVKEFMEELCNREMDYSKPLWEFYLDEDYSPTESLLLLRMHHAFSDAGGFVGLLS